MKKRNACLLALALAMTPAAGFAQDLPELFTQVIHSADEGLEQGAQMIQQSMDGELTLEISAGEGRIEEGKTALVTIVAGNPMAKETGVNITLKLPPRLKAAGETTFAAVLPAAGYDEESGAMLPSRTTFTREVTLLDGGESEQAAIECEMSMGTRFYRASTPLALCVPDVSVNAFVEDAQDSRLQPGEEFAYRIEIANAGDAPKDVTLEMTLPQAAALTAPLPFGFTANGGVLRGQVHAAAAEDGVPGSVQISLPARIAQDALAGDEDARRLIAGSLLADGEHVPLPRIEVCDAKISAKLTADETMLSAGEEAVLSVVVVNAGLAEADVNVSCMLPKGLSLAGGEKEEKREATAAETGVLPSGDGGFGADGAAAAVEGVRAAPAMQENRTLMLSVHMDAAKEEDGGVVASTQVVHIPVVADFAQEDLSEQLLGASLLWSVDDQPAQLGDAVALRVVRGRFLSMSHADLNGLFWAGVLLAAVVVCLCAAMRRESKETDFCCD